MKPFEFISHTADLRLRCRGSSLEELFANAMQGLFSAMGAHVDESGVEYQLALSAASSEDLLVDWLNELIALAEINKVTFESVIFDQLDRAHLTATVRGRRVTGFDLQVKSATHYDLQVERTDQGWQADITFDI